jgi:hypothetical protein
MSANTVLNQIASLQMQLTQLAHHVQAGAARAAATAPIPPRVSGLAAPGPGPVVPIPASICCSGYDSGTGIYSGCTAKIGSAGESNFNNCTKGWASVCASAACSGDQGNQSCTC